MKIKELVERCNLQTLTCPEGLEREANGCYIGDLLSWAMGKVRADNVWLTVMGNMNAIAVAVLADAACIIMVDGAVLDDAARAKAEEQNVTVLATEKSAYEMAIQIAEMG